MPVNHNSWSPIANMPFGQQVLVRGSKLFRIRGAGGCSLTPNLRLPDVKDCIGNMGNRIAELLFVDIAATCIAKIRVARARICTGKSLKSRIRSQPIEAQKKPSV